MPHPNQETPLQTICSRSVFPISIPHFATDYPKDVGVEIDGLGAGGAEGMAASKRITGVGETRREEIRQFLIERFTEYHKVDPKVREPA